METNVNYEDKALLYAEKYGIFTYEVNGNTMKYTEEFNENKGKPSVYQAEVNLDTMKEKRFQIK